MNTDARVDRYIAEAPDFARPILTEVRARVRRACPEANETIKWNVPFYVLAGKLLASMAAFKKHAKIGVWTGMKPNMRDVTQLSELPAAKAFERELKTAAASIAGVGTKPAEKIGKKTLAKKTATKQPSAENTSARKRVARKPVAKTVTKPAVAKKAAGKPQKAREP